MHFMFEINYLKTIYDQLNIIKTVIAFHCVMSKIAATFQFWLSMKLKILIEKS